MKSGKSTPNCKFKTSGKTVPIRYQQNRSAGGKFLPKCSILGGKSKSLRINAKSGQINKVLASTTGV